MPEITRIEYKQQLTDGLEKSLWSNHVKFLNQKT
jgi:hypothetical protein